MEKSETNDIYFYDSHTGEIMASNIDRMIEVLSTDIDCIKKFKNYTYHYLKAEKASEKEARKAVVEICDEKNKKNKKYTGEIDENGNLSGEGILEDYEKKRIYKGTFENGEPVQGKIIYEDETTYSGPIVDGEPNGYGIERDTKGNFKKGHFEKGKFVNGTMKKTYPNGDVYEGRIENGRYCGKGKMTYNNGNYYEGNFVNGDREGKGKFYWNKTKDTYNGNWRQNFREGHGELIKSNGDVYEGTFKNDKREGSFDLKSHDGFLYKTRFKNDKLLCSIKWKRLDDKMLNYEDKSQKLKQASNMPVKDVRKKKKTVGCFGCGK